MKLYSLNETAEVSGEEGSFTASADGSFELPQAFADRLHAIHLDGQPIWETDGERSVRLAKEDEEHRRDPSTMLASIEAIRSSLSAPPVSAADRVKAAKAALAEAESDAAAEALDSAIASDAKKASDAAAKKAAAADAKKAADAEAKKADADAKASPTPASK